MHQVHEQMFRSAVLRHQGRSDGPGFEAHAFARLRELLESSGVTAMQATPATWRLLLEAGWAGDSRLKILRHEGDERIRVVLIRGYIMPFHKIL